MPIRRRIKLETKKTAVPAKATVFIHSCHVGHVPVSVSQVGKPIRTPTKQAISSTIETGSSLRASKATEMYPSRNGRNQPTRRERWARGSKSMAGPVWPGFDRTCVPAYAQ
jgi:hypothetical protein